MTYITECRVCRKPKVGSQTTGRHGLICNHCRVHRRAEAQVLLAYWRECDDLDEELGARDA